ncbi:hypothetical protein JCGZ_25768 [Jatropha curcas]|uniref:Phytocyanin domain-containing protein n=1 Tax=Jatropha curcas TaxID=180498 RepID=A0A067JJG5_JATCU|nr:early nodulin-like protein 1 [Jatropha curcas]KDP24111.1 hypothetical protein JCGZ_25768 [Jatropha curcas]
MGFQRFLGFILFLMMGFLFGSSEAYKFYVGGRDGWVLNPSENYTQWPHRNRFQVNDTLFFKYKKGSDSVFVVKKDDFNSCNTKNPIQSLTDGDSLFTFDRSGPFYFISGHADNCKKGQKLIIIVLAVRPTKPSATPAPPSPSPLATPPESPSSLPTLSPPLPQPSPADSNGSEVAPPHSGSQSSTGFVGLVLGACIGLGFILG